MLRVYRYNVVFQEVPDEISLALTFSGCPLRCPGCHSVETWNPECGEPLTRVLLNELLSRYAGLISCVLFLGGDWQPSALEKILRQARATGLKTCLYSGNDSVPVAIFRCLTYLKTGPWIAARGGLDHPATNQRFIDCRDGRCLNHRFWRKHAYPEYRQIQRKIDFIDTYAIAKNAADASKVDANANVTQKNIATLEAELMKDVVIQTNRALISRKIAAYYDEATAREYVRQIEAHEIYVHDETSLKPYCVSVTLYPFLLDGMTKLGGEGIAPKHLASFCGSFVNLVSR